MMTKTALTVLITAILSSCISDGWEIGDCSVYGCTIENPHEAPHYWGPSDCRLVFPIDSYEDEWCSDDNCTIEVPHEASHYRMPSNCGDGPGPSDFESIHQ